MDPVTRTRIKAAALILMVVIPITLATWAFQVAVESGALFNTTNNGHLINPPVDITALDMRDEDGEFQFRSFEERIEEVDADDYVPEPWLMVMVSARPCDEGCVERVRSLRQLHITLGGDMPRLRRYFLHAQPSELPDALRTRFREDFPSMGLSFGDSQRMESGLSGGGVSLDLQEDLYVFIVDPVGNVMMYYDSSHGLREIQEDVERLLEFSSLG
ncbi:MAG: hypothetical protein WEB57_01075 [Pseudohongiellaceae bacterium]